MILIQSYSFIYFISFLVQKQATVESAAYGSEFNAGLCCRTARAPHGRADFVRKKQANEYAVVLVTSLWQ